MPPKKGQQAHELPDDSNPITGEEMSDVEDFNLKIHLLRTK